MHDRNGNLFLLQFVYLVHNILADMFFFFIGKFCQCPVCALSYSINDFLYIERLKTAIFLNDPDIFLRFKQISKFRSIFLHIAHPLSSIFHAPNDLPIAGNTL